MRKHRTIDSRLPLVVAAVAMISISGCDRYERASPSDTPPNATPVQPAMDRPMRREMSAFESAPGAPVAIVGIARDAAAPPVAQSAALS